MPSNTAQLAVGRLLEVRAAAGYRTAADVDAIFAQIGRELGKLKPGVLHVTVVDWRQCPVMAPEAADRLGKLIAGTNSGTDRSAALARTDSPSAVLQFLRVIRDAGLPDRKLFDDPIELYTWLAEILTPAECKRLRTFLQEA